MIFTHPVDALLTSLRADPGRPRVTWYDGDERVELSGHVLDNWVSKTTNLLVEELDVGPGSTVLVDLPAHWRAIVWWLAVLRSGACLTTSADAAPAPDVVVTTDPTRSPTAPELVVVALPALARRAEVPLPPGAIDAAAAVMTYGDVLGFATEPTVHDPAVRLGAPPSVTTVGYADLLDWAARQTGETSLTIDGVPAVGVGPGDARVLITARGAVPGLLATALTVLAGNGSIVLCSAGMTDVLLADRDRLDRLRASERVTG